jgi:uncharacterized protein YndB with AHSA1/START domain
MTERLADRVVQKAITVRCPAADAFELFTGGIHTWWPLSTHSLGKERAARAVVEGRVGGRVYEVWHDGTERPWGTVSAWEPPTRIVLSWFVGSEPDAATEVEVRFLAESDAVTRVELEHRGWQALGEAAEESAASYESGWDFVLGEFTSRAAPA